MDTIVGGWTKYRTVTNPDIEIFKEAMKELVGVTYEPLIVSTQTVAGTNYKFICNATPATLSPIEYLAQVFIFKPLPNAEDTKAVLINIDTLTTNANNKGENCMEQQYFLFTPHPEDSQMKTTSYCIDYISSNVRWTATYSEGKFYHYRNGNKEEVHTSDHLDYKTEDGSTWRLEIRDGKMFVGANKDSLKQGKMVYKGWDGATWTAELVKFIDFHPELKK